MTARRGWMVCLLVCITANVVLPTNNFQEQALASNSLSQSLGFYEQMLATQARATNSHLSLAAAYLSEGNHEAACDELMRHLADYPEHFEARIHRAELTLQLGRIKETQREFDRAIADAQEVGDSSLARRVHCHCMLKEIAEGQNDDYAWHFHRGVGLYLIAIQRARLPEPDGTLPVEGLLCKAAGELQLAHLQRPSEAQACWYLHEVWAALGKNSNATRWLERAKSAAPFSMLTPNERRSLELASCTVAGSPIRR